MHRIYSFRPACVDKRRGALLEVQRAGCVDLAAGAFSRLRGIAGSLPICPAVRCSFRADPAASSVVMRG
ncbi:hypothetical protein BOC41_14705 [Burkholderia pseudomallei]|nr:hypothetical protein BOC41_14705 [Burkholderia pseudomallei]